MIHLKSRKTTKILTRLVLGKIIPVVFELGVVVLFKFTTGEVLLTEFVLDEVTELTVELSSLVLVSFAPNGVAICVFEFNETTGVVISVSLLVANEDISRSIVSTISGLV